MLHAAAAAAGGSLREQMLLFSSPSTQDRWIFLLEDYVITGKEEGTEVGNGKGSKKEGSRRVEMWDIKERRGESDANV